MPGTVNSLSKFGYIVMGFVQFAAIWSLFSGHWGWHWLPAGMFALFLSYIPLIGSICGLAGAIMVWEWPWWLALLLFFWWPVLFLTLAALGLGAGFLTLRRLLRQAPPSGATTLETHTTIYMDDDPDNRNR